MEKYYKEQIVKLLETVNEEKFLRYLYYLINEMVAKGCSN